MAKDHLLPRYLLRAAVCVCVLLGLGVLVLPLAVRGLPFAFGNERSVQSKQLKQIYRAEIGVLEATGDNDGGQVEEYLRYCGLGEGYAWAAALFPASRIIWHAGDAWPPVSSGQPIPRTGDVFGIYYTNLKRIAHMGFVDGWDGKYCITVEGNTGPPTGDSITADDPANPIRAGPSIDGVYRKRRPVRTTRAVARWAE